jgi:hypothetical protein
MKTKEKLTSKSWPRHLVKKVETRKRDLVIRIANWKRDRDEPGYDVEVYDRGVYDWNLSKTCKTKQEAVEFAQKKIMEVLK